MSDVLGDVDDRGVPDALADPGGAEPVPAGPGRRLHLGPGLDRASTGPGRAPAPPGAAGPLRLGQLPLLVLTVSSIEVPHAASATGGEATLRAVQHVVAGEARRAATVTGVQLPLSETGLDRAAGLISLGSDHRRGCLAAHGVSLGDATRYAARLERLGLRAERCWGGLAEGYYGLDAEPWNLHRLVDPKAIAGAEQLLQPLSAPGGGGARPAALVLLGPTCTTAA